MKKLFTLIICISLLSISENFAQNLVPNPGFEIQDSCPAVSEIFVAPPWNSPQSGTPDLMNSTCPSQNFPGHTGIGSSGIFCYHANWLDNREYIQAPLISPLIAGHTYCVSFYVKRSNYRFAIDRMGAFFSVGAVNVSMSTDYLPFTPQVENTPGNMLSATGWILIEGFFTASGGEDNIIIGNFSPDAQTSSLVVNGSSASEVAYYMIDDISVTECTVGIEENSLAAFTIHHSKTENKLIATVNTDASPGSILLYNSTGQLIETAILENHPGRVVVSHPSLPAGMYFLQMEFGGRWITQKFVN